MTESEIKPIKTDLTGTITLTIDGVTAHCPFTNDTDTYKVVITLSPVGGCVPEYESFSAWLGSFEDTAITQEDFTKTIIDTVNDVIEPSEITVEVTGTHNDVTAVTTEIHE